MPHVMAAARLQNMPSRSFTINVRDYGARGDGQTDKAQVEDQNSEIILEFKEDGTFINRYADVTTGNGLWRKIDNNLYSFDYIVEDGNANNPDSLTNYITFYCDNTYSVSVDGDDTAIYYYKTIGAAECSELITYNVTD